MELTFEQNKAKDIILDWVASGDKLLTLGGYAGTGKTTLIGFVSQELKARDKKIAFCTVSGKASTVLKSKLRETLTEQDYCGTIHSLIYRLIGKETLKSGRSELYFAPNNAELAFDLIILDEASMVNEYIYRDLAEHGIPILAVGDHGQLPPVKGTFNLMENPQIKLEKIMRQAEGNPIIQMAMMARLDGVIKYGIYGDGCFKTRDTKVLHTHEYNMDSIMLCAMNKTRVSMNSFAREILKIGDPHPVVGEPLICLYNNHKKLIYNGNIGKLLSAEMSQVQTEVFNEERDYSLDEDDDKRFKTFDSYKVAIDMGDFIFENDIYRGQFGKAYTTVEEKSSRLDYFDWGYCITTHKAQGSEWKNVLIMEEADFMFKGEMWNRWLYTAVTRAKERLIIYKR